jgi:hypothetical protein
MTLVTTGPIRSFYSLRGRSHDRLACTACGSWSDPPATPALAPSGYLLAALALLVLVPPAILGWLAGAWVIRCGWVSPGAPGRSGRRHQDPCPPWAPSSVARRPANLIGWSFVAAGLGLGVWASEGEGRPGAPLTR